MQGNWMPTAGAIALPALQHTAGAERHHGHGVWQLAAAAAGKHAREHPPGAARVGAAGAGGGLVGVNQLVHPVRWAGRPQAARGAVDGAAQYPRKTR